MDSANLKNKWLIAISAVGIHISIGSVYAYSVMTNPLKELNGWSNPALAFSVAIVCLGLTSAFLGFLVDKRGPRFSGRLAAICYGIGQIGTGFAAQTGSFPLFVLSYGVLGGVGLGLGYITPVTTLMKWFPNRRGLATGMAIMGFGFSALIFGPLMAYLFKTISIPVTFYLLGIVYFFLMFASASYLEPPPEGWVPEGHDPTKQKDNKQSADLSDSTAHDSLKTLRFYLLWLMLFINITCGIGIISAASPLAQEVTGMTALQAAGVVGLMGLFNGLGRFLWASFSDIIGRPITYAAFFVLQILAFMFIVRLEGVILFQILLYLILTCYGGGFATVPAFLGDLFGTKEVGTIHGYLLTAWSAAGAVGPMLVTWLRESTGSYVISTQIFAGFFVAALMITGILLMNMRRVRARSADIQSEV